MLTTAFNDAWMMQPQGQSSLNDTRKAVLPDSELKAVSAVLRSEDRRGLRVAGATDSRELSKIRNAQPGDGSGLAVGTQTQNELYRQWRGNRL